MHSVIPRIVLWRAGRYSSPVSRPTRWLWLLSAALTVAGCTKSNSEVGSSQVVAKVNKSEITVSQLNAAMSRLPTNMTPDAAKAASGQALQQLIDEELLVQKAREAKLDRNPGVMQAIEAAKRSLLANAYLQQAAAGAAQPSELDIKAFYNQHPDIFAERRIYDGRSIPILASPEQVEGIRQQLAATKNLDALLDNLRAQHLAVAVSSFTKSAEQLPPDALARFAALKDGEFITVPYAGGIEVVQVLSSRLEPLGETQARPLIQKYLVEQGRKQRADEAIKALRLAAAIQIVGDVKPATAANPIPTKATPKPGASDATAGIGAGIK